MLTIRNDVLTAAKTKGLGMVVATPADKQQASRINPGSTNPEALGATTHQRLRSVRANLQPHPTHRGRP